MENRGDMKWRVLAVIVLVFSAGIVIADYDYVSNSINTNYQAGQRIEGNVVLSFDDEPSTSVFTSNFPGNITLLGLLQDNNLQENVHYTCAPAGCAKGYVEIGTATSLSLTGSDRLVGFKLTGDKIRNHRNTATPVSTTLPSNRTAIIRSTRASCLAICTCAIITNRRI